MIDLFVEFRGPDGATRLRNATSADRSAGWDTPHPGLRFAKADVEHPRF